MLAPDDQQARLLLAHPGLPLGIGVHIGSVIVEKVALDVSLARLIEKGKFIGPKIWVVALHIWIVAKMTCPGSCQGQQIRTKRAFIRRPIRPKGATRLPVLAKTFVVRDCILNNERFCALRMRKHHAKTYGAAVILHIEGVTLEPERFGEVIHELG